MIAFFDVNTIWTRKFGEALRRRYPNTLLFAPRAAFRSRAPLPEEGLVSVVLPPGWWRRTAIVSIPLLGIRANALVAERGGSIDTAVFTHFHYLPIARKLRNRSRIIYHCFDDYRSYPGWGSDGGAAREAEFCKLASLSVFVSTALRERAIAEYGLDPAACIVVPNASEPRFSAETPRVSTSTRLPGPVYGSVGVFNDRIDFGFLERLANSAEVGSLALIGPLRDCPDSDGAIARTHNNPKVHWFGAQPHDELHTWMAQLDVAVIPYARTRLNHFCSPMRLWDHLAIGHPIIATDTCHQIERSDRIFVVAPEDSLDKVIGSANVAASKGLRPHLESWDDRVALLPPWIT